MKVVGLTVALTIALAAGGCGQKGPLYLPDKHAKVVAPVPAASATPATPAAAAPATAPAPQPAPKPNDKDQEGQAPPK